MTEAAPEATPGDAAPRDVAVVPFVVRALTVAIVLAVPLLVVGQGYLPDDDALRHAAKAVSGKGWDEILVLRGDMPLDSHPGWHTVLTWIHRLTSADTHSLVLFSVIVAFVVVSLGPVLLLRRPEAWLLALVIVMAISPALPIRLLRGRPFVLTMGLVTVICLLWQRFGEPRVPWRTLATVTCLSGLVVWMHPSWYLLGLPVAGFLLAGEVRGGVRLAACLVAGIALGATLTGSPLDLLWQSLAHVGLAFGGSGDRLETVREFQPGISPPLVAVCVAGLLGLRYLRGAWRADTLRNPPLVIAAMGWVLGFLVVRFWTDWGVPAVLVWMAMELQELLEEQIGARHWRRMAAALAMGLTCVLVLSSDVGGRWSTAFSSARPLIPALKRPGSQAWLPEPGGIIYSNDMRVFYEVFYHRPRAPWRFAVGYEPGLMPPEDRAVFSAVRRQRSVEALGPWLRKMKPEDRLILFWANRPSIEALAWEQVAPQIWSGRLPTKAGPS